jgi:hypothetical protein
MQLFPQIARRSVRIVLSLFTTALIVVIAAWLDAATNRQARQSFLVTPRMRDRFDAARRGVLKGVPPLARTRAVAAMRGMPMFTSGNGWTFIGPDSISEGQGLSTQATCGPPSRISVSGRVTAIGFGAQGMYVGSASGGVWKSSDGGAQWTPLTDQQVSLAVGAMAVLPGPPDTIYVGTGEGNNGCDNEYGQGILKSSDGGATWTQLGAATFDRLTFTKIAVDAANPKVLYAATSFGYTGGSAGECFSVSTGTSGLYKSSDGGDSWKLLSGTGGLAAGASGATSDGSGSVYDVAIDPAKTFSGPFTGTVVSGAGAGCAGSAMLTAVDPSNPEDTNPFKLVARPVSSGYTLDASLTLTQNPAAGLNPPGICDDFSGTYTCAGKVANLNGAQVSGLTCVGGNFNDGAGATLTLAGRFINGTQDDGSFAGSWSLDAGAGPDKVDNAPLPLAAAPAILAAVGGATGGLFESSDAGMTWNQAGAIEPGRRFAMDFASDGSRLYVASTTLTTPSGFGFLYVSSDGGATFAIADGQPVVDGASCTIEDQGDQDLALGVDPVDPGHLYLGMVGVYASNDGGNSFSYQGAGVHAGQHAINVNGGRVYVGNDGGLFQSANGGGTWTPLNNGLAVVQFNSVAMDSGATKAFGGTQDNGSNQSAAVGLTWSHADDGDGGSALIDQSNPAIYFDEQSGLSINRSTRSGALGSFADISPGAAASDPFALFVPFTADPSNPERIVLGTIRLWESCHSNSGTLVCDGASSPSFPIWTLMSADLTGGCTSALCDISAIAVAPTKPDVMYTVTSSDGVIGPMVWVTQNGTSLSPTFTNITPGGVAGRPLTSVAVSPLNFNEVVITASGFTGGGSHVFLSSDMGGSWSDISADLPDIPVLSAVFDPSAPFASMFVGTDIGVFHTADLGQSWTNANVLELPVVPVYQLTQSKGVVAAATHGRGVWTWSGPFPGPTPTPIGTPTPTATPTPGPSPTLSPTPTPIPGHPFISSVPPIIDVGTAMDLPGINFTSGSVVNFFVATSSGPINAGPLIPTGWTATDLTVSVPRTTPLGQGFVSLQVVNTDQSYVTSNVVFALLQGSAAAGIPTITGVNGMELAPTSGNPDYATNNVETVIDQGDLVVLSGKGFDTTNGVAINLFCACPGGLVGPFKLFPGDPGLTATSISFTLPASGMNAPATGPGSLVVINKGSSGSYTAASNAVSVPIGQQISITSVSQSGLTVTVNGTGFSTSTVINFFNLQGTTVVNLGGLAGGAPAIPIALSGSTQFTFTLPPSATPGPAYVQALNPPYVPFTSSGNDPGGAFVVH